MNGSGRFEGARFARKDTHAGEKVAMQHSCLGLSAASSTSGDAPIENALSRVRASAAPSALILGGLARLRYERAGLGRGVSTRRTFELAATISACKT